MTEQDIPKQDSPNPGETWVTSVYGDKSLDTIATGNFGEVMKGILAGKDASQILGEAAANDPNVFLKNKLLAKLGDLAGERYTHASKLLALLENQAESLDPKTREIRDQQFRGMLQIIVTCFNDKELHDLFEQQKESLQDTF